MSSDHEPEDSADATRTAAEKRLFEIRMKMNAGRKKNKELAEEEHMKASLPAGKAKKWSADVDGAAPKREVASVPKDKAYMLDTVVDAELKAKKSHKKEKQKAAFGWEVFNQDSLYNAYKKRLHALPTEKVPGSTSTKEYDELEYGKNDGTTEEGVDRMVAELAHRADVKKKFSRRRQHYDGEDVDYINNRNRVFNKKISRAFDKYTVEIRQNLERGTAL
ncbi:hypothetical protein H257_02368 [Aphanomyces astaci]|uniref:Pre-mRNA-splicing factor SYF2 n=1 Tax=Aphanomyces astaci TaxID=112090 RepID=W4H3R8_APHAT|nr:hypothetical protein H257_02368 [Aphanomyces astaci]ETV85798.1 hypothetical protein H257_02368 [Aphanomyces astaci]KAF0703005.1 hypothetical protein AaE_015597 [Aphanomyces astaci]RHY11688.1 hypothetical protein DYB36_000100 [Aphanomyces astaci]RHY17305.1 hypothetical protein DYB25_011458 [Aphanomyces astaci]RHY39638.1 hypothetical protein DYB38_003202 [Aphanomyces astaci]|eukprot:XP_009824270.1 hypothetical protein H257_02368 [Aphanomyces astaci]